MTHILVINSSISGPQSVSRILVEDAVQRLLEAHPGATVSHRDLGARPIPHLLPETMAGVRASPTTEREQETSALSQTLIGEVVAADILLLGAPMYNFSVATGLRAWFDHVIRPRVTFAYGEAGVQGLIHGKRAIVIETRGGRYTEGPAALIDFQEPYLRHLLGFIGVTDVSFVRAENIGFGPEARAAAIAQAKSEIAVVAGRPLPVQ